MCRAARSAQTSSSTPSANHTDGSGREPRYYQQVAINRTISAIARGRQRILLVMATGTGKTYTAFQIIWRLWKAGRMKRVLFLADRNILIDQTIQQDFAPFGEVMHKITNRTVERRFEVYLSLYQAVTGNAEWKQIYRQFPPDFFDLVIIDECHRGSAAEDSAWREVLEYFDGATHLGLTATPKEKRPAAGNTLVEEPEYNLKYFGNPIYTYSLKQGIDDGFLAPYKVIRVVTGVDAKTCKLIVLDQNINSMTQFKQILGRGTRIREDYNKLYFTIMDFKNATRLFQDPACDGEPVTVHEPGPDDPIVPPEETDQDGAIEDEGQAGHKGADPEATKPKRTRPERTGDPATRPRYIIDDVPVAKAIERAQTLNAEGKLVTESYRGPLRDQVRQGLRREFATLDDFLHRWSEAERKQAVLDELADRGIPLHILREAVPDGAELDVFDLVAHVAFDQPPLSRRERAERVRKRNYFGKYGDDARAVLEGLLDKYADHGIADLEDPKVLELPPFDRLGSKTAIRRRIFGGADKFSAALTELERELYRDSA